MILDGKDQDIDILMTQLELENDANSVPRCYRRKGDAQWIHAKHVVDNDLEPKLQSFEISELD
jgi:hypothetical protein